MRLRTSMPIYLPLHFLLPLPCRTRIFAPKDLFIVNILYTLLWIFFL